jgi:small subunit ribosomal protein S6
MVRYEVLILTIPEITQDENKKLESLLDQVIKEGKGSVISFERWGKYRLAYPVRKNEYGVYYLIRFETEAIGNLLEEIKAVCALKLYDVVMRFIITRLEGDSLVYQRPQSLEETTSRDVGSFLTEGLGGRRRGRRDEEVSHSSFESTDSGADKTEWFSNNDKDEVTEQVV